MNPQLFSLHERLSSLGVDALLFNTSELLSSTNLQYLSGFTGSDATMLVTRTERHLFTDGRYKTQAGQEAQGFRVHVTRNKLASLIRMMTAVRLRKLGIESSRVSYEFVAHLTKRVPQLEIIPLQRGFIESLRIHKTAEERQKIREAAAIASSACRKVIDGGLVGKKETEVAGELEALFRTAGAEAIAFDTIVASGERSALPHGKASERTIGPNQPVVIDYGCRFQGYNSDETVTCLTGSPSSEHAKIHQAVYDAHNKALDAAKVGVRARALDTVARNSIEKAGYGKYFLHSLGHGVGMEVHEPPYLSPRGRGVLEEGMVFTIEPGIYIAGVGGVRLESLVFLERTGPELLSRMPKDLIVCG
ncbi:MAG: Xaa-Pro peptidase family protein [Desulfomonilaceae bacterium]